MILSWNIKLFFTFPPCMEECTKIWTCEILNGVFNISHVQILVNEWAQCGSTAMYGQSQGSIATQTVGVVRNVL